MFLNQEEEALLSAFSSGKVGYFSPPIRPLRRDLCRVPRPGQRGIHDVISLNKLYRQTHTRAHTQQLRPLWRFHTPGCCLFVLYVVNVLVSMVLSLKMTFTHISIVSPHTLFYVLTFLFRFLPLDVAVANVYGNRRIDRMEDG